MTITTAAENTLSTLFSSQVNESLELARNGYLLSATFLIHLANNPGWIYWHPSRHSSDIMPLPLAWNPHETPSTDVYSQMRTNLEPP